jgi:WD40 repeat protein
MVKAINGTVKDAWMDKSADILYLATSQPNRLQAYDTKTKTVAREIILNYAPNCFSVSEDGTKAVVGHNGRISYIDLNNSAVETTDVDHIIFDIEWGADNWCCYSVGGNVQWTNLYWVNLTTKEKFMSNNSIYENCIIKKIPHKDFIIASATSITGVYVFDINTKEQINDITISFHNFWFSADGAYLFSIYKDVYRTSALPATTSLSPIGWLNYDSEYYNNEIEWIDHSPITNSLWVLRKYINFYLPDAEVLQLDDSDYSHIKTYNYDDYYVTSINGVQANYPVTAHYAFANSYGTELIVVRNVSDGNNAWSLEHIPVNN